jgi:hypothetical protein
MNKTNFKKSTWFIALTVTLGLFIFTGCHSAAEVSTSSTSTSSTANTSSISSSSMPINSSSATKSSKPTADSAIQNISDKDKIISAAKKEFGEENFIDVNYNPSNNFALIKAKGKESLTSKMTVKGMYISIADILKNLKDIKNTDIAFNIVYPLQDTSGNSSDTIVIKATYKHSSRSKINWESFSWKNVPDIADEWWIHNALKNALA